MVKRWIGLIVHIIRKASTRILAKRSIAVIGYGSQGRAQALNLRDAGHEAAIGLPSRSRSRHRAKADGLAVTTPARAAANADIVFILAPDHLHGALFEKDLASSLRPGQMLVFAHASSIHFKSVVPPSSVDVILLAPLGPGKRLRELCGERQGVPCFLAVHQNPSGRARQLGLALARAIGCIPAGAVETTFADEAVGDLFGEQAVLCGGLGELLMAGVETLIRRGLSPQNAYLECVYQLDLIVDLIKSDGLEGMYRRISPTAAYGARHAGAKVISTESRRAMDELCQEIESGKFFRAWVKRGRRATSRSQIIPRIPPVFTKAEDDILRAFGSRPGKSK